MSKFPFQDRDHVRRIWPFLDQISRRAWDRAGVPQDDKTAVNSAAGELFTQITRATRDLPEYSSDVEQSLPPFGLNADEDNWTEFARDELVGMIGRQDIHSVTDAFLKSICLLKVLQKTSNTSHQRFLFRGQQNISWSLRPRLARKLLADGWKPPEFHLDDRNRTQTLHEELASLAEFRFGWDSLEEVETIDRDRPLPDDSAEWWFRMQHYDRHGGTRLLDVTTSLTAALLFACVDWDSGAVDSKTDGIIYFWAEGFNSNVDDFLIHRAPVTAEELFCNHPDAPRIILNPPHNERSKAQSGAFLWWPRFWEDPPYGAPFFLRVSAPAKTEIVRDLLSLGFGPKEAVRGQKGLRNESLLREQLGLPKWEPLGLQEASACPSSTEKQI